MRNKVSFMIYSCNYEIIVLIVIIEINFNKVKIVRYKVTIMKY